MAEQSKNTVNSKKATFAGGCFWCMEPPFQQLPGVIQVKAGYTGGEIANPTYEDVCSGRTGHYEAVEILYDPQKVSYEQLVDVFWRNIDPTDEYGQFADKGSQYRTALFYHDETQQAIARASKTELEKSSKFNRPVATKILPATQFYYAEEYHQNYYLKNPIHYTQYKKGSGREAYIHQMWKDPKQSSQETNDNESVKPKPKSKKELKSSLTPLQYHVTQEQGTEPPFKNEYWNNQREGIYVDIVSGEVLFSSKEKFDSQCGWPSFYKPFVGDNIVEKPDHSLFMNRIEVRSKGADSHLGHVFSDGPAPTGLRYCINSAAVRFVPKEDMKKQGYEQYLSLFDRE